MCCSLGCCCCDGSFVVIYMVIVGDLFVSWELEVVATGFGGVVPCSNVVMLFIGVGMSCMFVYFVEEWGCGVRVIVGVCMSVVFAFAVEVFVAWGAVCFWGACQKTCVAFLGLPPNF